MKWCDSGFDSGFGTVGGGLLQMVGVQVATIECDEEMMVVRW